MILTSWMAWTPEEIAQVRAAVLDLTIGKRVVSVSYAGPPARSVQYHPADLGQLRSLLTEMEDSLVVRCAPRFRRVAFGKGFGPPPGEE